jgi:hypothetical protein
MPLWPNRGSVPALLEGVRKTTESLSQNSRCPDADLSQASSYLEEAE